MSLKILIKCFAQYNLKPKNNGDKVDIHSAKLLYLVRYLLHYRQCELYWMHCIEYVTKYQNVT
jgi:hypothetical protein